MSSIYQHSAQNIRQNCESTLAFESPESKGKGGVAGTLKAIPEEGGENLNVAGFARYVGRFNSHPNAGVNISHFQTRRMSMETLESRLLSAYEENCLQAAQVV
jgi:hypothetical protein